MLDILNNEINPETGITPVKSNQNIKSQEPSFTGGIMKALSVDSSSSTGMTLGGDLGIDMDEYTGYTGKDVNPFFQDLDAMRAGSQGGLELLGKGLGNFLNTGIGEILKIPGYIGGIAEGIANFDPNKGSDVELMINNEWLNTIQDAQDEISENYLQIYKTKAQEESFWKGVTSPEFWADDFSNAMGFFAAMMVPGALLSKVGVGAKTVKMLGAGTADSSSLLKLAGGSKKLANTIDVGLSTMVNTAFEAAAETSNFNRAIKEEYEGYRQADGNYILPNGDELNKDQVDEVIGSASASLYNSNLALLILPNMVVNNALYGKLGKKNWFKKYGKNVKDIKSKLGALTVKQKAKDISATVAKGVASEGLVEEAGQMTAENFFDEQAKSGKTSSDNMVKGLAKEYLKTLTSVEGQKAVLLGGILGGGVGGVQAFRGAKKEQENTKKLKDAITNGINDIETASGIWKSKDGKVTADIGKLKEAIETNSNLSHNYTNLQQGIEENDNDMIRRAWDSIFMQFAKNYVTEDGGIDFMKKHFDELADTFLHGVTSYIAQNEGDSKASNEKAVKDVQKMKESLYRRADYLQQTYDDISTVGPNFFKLNTNDLFNNTEEMKAKDPMLLKLFEARLNENTLAISNTLFSLKEELDETNSEIARHSLSQSPISPRLIENELEPRKKVLEKQIEIETQKYNEQFDKAKQKEAFETFVKNTRKNIQNNENLIKAEKDMKERFLPSFKTALAAKGYETKKGANNFAKAGTYFKGTKGEVYRLSQSEGVNELGTRLDLVDVSDGTRLPFNDAVALELGLDNSANIINKKEGAELEKKYKRKKKKKTNEVENDDDFEEQSSGEKFTTGPRKSNAFSTIVALLDKNGEDGDTNPNGLRWSKFFSQSNPPVEKTEVVIVNRKDLLAIDPSVENELPHKENPNEIYTLVMIDGKLIKMNGKAVYAGIPYRETLETEYDADLKIINQPIDWHTYINKNLGIDLHTNQLSDDNSFKYNNKIYTDNAELLENVEYNVLQEFEKWRATLQSGNVLKVQRISNGIAQFGKTVNPLSSILKVDRVIVPQNTTYDHNGTIVNVSPGQAYAITKDDKLVKVGNRTISELPNASKTIDSIISMLGYVDHMDSITGEVLLDNNQTQKLFSTKGSEGILSKYIRLGRSKSENGQGKVFDLSMAGTKKGLRYLLYNKPIEGLPGRFTRIEIPLRNIVDNNGKVIPGNELEMLREVIGNKFANVDISSLEANHGNKFSIATSIDFATGIATTEPHKSYTDYLTSKYLTTSIIPADHVSLPQFGNQYLEIDMNAKVGKMEIGTGKKVVKKKGTTKTPPPPPPSSKGKTGIKLVTKFKQNAKYVAEVHMTDGSFFTQEFEVDTAHPTVVTFAGKSSNKIGRSLISNAGAAGGITPAHMESNLQDYWPTVESVKFYTKTDYNKVDEKPLDETEQEDECGNDGGFGNPMGI